MSSREKIRFTTFDLLKSIQCYFSGHNSCICYNLWIISGSPSFPVHKNNNDATLLCQESLFKRLHPGSRHIRVAMNYENNLRGTVPGNICFIEKARVSKTGCTNNTVYSIRINAAQIFGKLESMQKNQCIALLVNYYLDVMMNFVLISDGDFGTKLKSVGRSSHGPVTEKHPKRTKHTQID